MNPCKNEWQQKWLQLDVVCPAIQVLADQCQEFAFAWYQRKPNPNLIVLTGLSGVGKTHCARRIASWARLVKNRAWEEGKWRPDVPSVHYVSWSEIVDGFKNNECGVIEDLYSASILIIDDLGAENDPWKTAVSKLCQVFNRREKLYTFVTTNIVPEQWATKFDIRIADRLMRGESRTVNLQNVSSYAAQ
jgi:DNA replication protein DnaC